MNKKLILLLTAGLMAAQLIGCGNNKQESVEEESAVEISTADSDDNARHSNMTTVKMYMRKQKYPVLCRKASKPMKQKRECMYIKTIQRIFLRSAM